MVQTTRHYFFLIEGKGIVNFGSQGEIKINNVYFVHGLAFNLLSLRSIANKGLILMFDDKECLIYQGPNRIVGQ
jgi:hypothetical protein